MKEAKGLVGHIVTNITGDPDCYSIEDSIDENGALLTLTISKDQAGRVIGRKGATADAMRNLLRALGLKNGHKYSLKIVIDERGAF